MFKRILLAGALGGLALFVWESVAHMMLPLGEAGFRALPNEAVVMAGLKEQVKQEGLYIFPAPEDRPGMSAAEKSKAMEVAMAKAQAGPAGLLLIHPQGEEAMSPRQLITQLAVDILAMIAAAWILSKAGLLKSYWSRVGLVTALALFPIIQVHIPNWTWYGFPSSFTLAAAATHLVGFLIGGLVVAKMVRPI
jgi:hypothetical protein